MPVYNDADYLEESIESINKQTLEDIELICIDDGSTDDSLDILHRLAEEYDFIKIFSQENQGSGKARNMGIKNAEGEYIAFLDSDDIFIDRNALEIMYNLAISKNYDMVSANLKGITNDGKLVNNDNLERFETENIISPEEYGIPYSFYKNIFKRDFIQENNFYFPDLKRGQDPIFLANILTSIKELPVVPVDLYGFRYSQIGGLNKIDSFDKKYDYIKHFKDTFDILNNANFNDMLNEYKEKFFLYLKNNNNSKDYEIYDSIHEIFKNNEYDILKESENYFSYMYPTISVVVPVYNAEPFLEEALSSILNQTFKDFEVLCVNDGSSDNSFKLLNEFANKDPRVKIINKPNGGCGSARNMGLDFAHGDYIYFFDPDDYVLPDAFEKLYKNAVKNDSDLVMFKIARFRDGESVDYSIPGFDFDKLFKNTDFNNFTFDYHDIKDYVLNSSFAPWSKLYKKEFIDKYDDFRFDLGVAFDDVPFHVKSLIRASKISFVPEFFYHYRLSNPNSVNNTKSNQIDIFKICDLVEEFLVSEGVFKEFKDEFYAFKIAQICNYIISCNYEPYYQLAKEEFSKIDISNLELPNYIVGRYNNVLNSNSYNEYRAEYGAESVDSVVENNDEVKVSVIIPVYNTEEYLEECLDSIVNQTLKEIEIFCIDDGSTDNSLSILERYAEKDDRITVISQPNKGQGASRNRAMDLASGKYIYFMDSDDFIDLGTLKTTYDVCEEKSLDFAMFQLINYNDVTHEFYDSDYYNMKDLSNEIKGEVFNYKDVPDLMFLLAVSPCNKLFNREFLLKVNARFPENLKFEDNVFYYNVYLQAERIFFIEKHMYKRRRRANSVTSSNKAHYLDIIKITDLVYNLFRDLDLFDEFEEGLYNFKFYSIFLWFNMIHNDHRNDFYLKIKENIAPIASDIQLYDKYLEKLEPQYKILLNSLIESNTSDEFDLLVKIGELEKENNKLRVLNNTLLNSTSWRFTALFRKIGAYLRKIKNLL